MILLIDNYDSFTYNLVQRLGEIDPTLDLVVKRNDEITLDQLAELAPSHLIVSPGPCTPSEAGISCAAINRFTGQMPILGVCLGHQAIGQANGARIVRAERLMHGKTDMIHHDGQGLFAGLPNPLQATRYHSLVIQPGTLGDEFIVCAWSDGPNGEPEIMGIRHREQPLFGVQFHPESFLTVCGSEILINFLRLGSPAQPAGAIAGAAPRS